MPFMPFSVPRSPPELPPESGDPFCDGGKMRSMSLATAVADRATGGMPAAGSFGGSSVCERGFLLARLIFYS